MRVVFIERGHFETFATAAAVLRDVPDVRVMWDRREATRRGHAREALDEQRRHERRVGERRRQPPTSWTETHCVVVTYASKT